MGSIQDQRVEDELEVETGPLAPTIVRVDSHWLEFPTDRRPTSEQPFEREEVHPVVRVSVPRAGTVRAQFACDRSVASYYSEDGTSTRRMGEWRVILRSVHVDQNDVFPPEASGIGPVARAHIYAQGEPMILAWLESSAYRVSRRKTAAYAYRRVLTENAGRGASAMYRAREALDAIEAELAPMEFASLNDATMMIAAGLELVDREPVG